MIEEKFDPDRTILALRFKKKVTIKKVTKKAQMQYDKILDYIGEDKEYSIQDFCQLLNLKESRIKDILKGLADYIEPIDSNRNRRYMRKK